MQLSPHFSLAEFTLSQTAARKGLDNTPDATVIHRLTVTAINMERVRDVLGDRPISVSSGYRALAVNQAVGGSATSAHVLGWACDFICPAFGDPLAICHALAASDLKFDQLIEEGTWVHISFDPRMRRQVKTKTATGYADGLTREFAQ